MDAIAKIAQAAYANEMELLFELAEHEGLELDPFLRQEKRAAFRALCGALTDDEIRRVDALVMDGSALEKTAQFGALGRLLMGVGGKALSVGERAIGKARFSKFLAGRGRTPEFIEQSWSQFQRSGGPMGWMTQRRLQLAGAPRLQAARGEAARSLAPIRAPGPAMEHLVRRVKRLESLRRGGRVGKVPTREQAAGALTGQDGKLWPQLRSGLLWGGGFGLGQRVLAPREEPEVTFGY